MIIQKANSGDSHRILELVVQLRKSACLEMGEQVPSQLLNIESETYLKSLFNRLETYLFIAKEHNEIVGFCMAVETPKITEAKNRLDILELVVDEKHRGKGIGVALLTQIELIAKEKGILYIKVATGTKMKSNEFYKKRIRLF